MIFLTKFTIYFIYMA